MSVSKNICLLLFLAKRDRLCFWTSLSLFLVPNTLILALGLDRFIITPRATTQLDRFPHLHNHITHTSFNHCSLFIDKQIKPFKANTGLCHLNKMKTKRQRFDKGRNIPAFVSMSEISVIIGMPSHWFTVCSLCVGELRIPWQPP